MYQSCTWMKYFQCSCKKCTGFTQQIQVERSCGVVGTPVFFPWCICVCGRGGGNMAVCIETRYGLDGPEIESRWGERLSAPVQNGPRAQPASYTTGTKYLSRGVKRSGRSVDHRAPSSVEVKDRVELYLYCPSGLSWTSPRQSLHFYLIYKFIYLYMCVCAHASVLQGFPHFLQANSMIS